MAQFGTSSGGIIPTPAAAFEHPIALEPGDLCPLPWPTSSASQTSGGNAGAAAGFPAPLGPLSADAGGPDPSWPVPVQQGAGLAGGRAVQASSGQPLALDPEELPFHWPSKIVAAGPFYVYAENDADFTTSSATPVNALTLTTEVIPPGDYLISTYGETTQNTTGASSTVDLELDGTDITATRNGAEVDTADSFPRAGFALRTFTTAAAHTLNLRIQVTTGSTTIRRRRILIQQLRPFKADGFRY